MDIDPERRRELLLMTAQGQYVLANEVAEFSRKFDPSKWKPYTLTKGKRATQKVYRTAAGSQMDDLPEGYVEHEGKVKHVSEVPGMEAIPAPTNVRPSNLRALNEALTTAAVERHLNAVAGATAPPAPPPPLGGGVVGGAEPWNVPMDDFVRRVRSRGGDDRVARRAHYQSVAGAIRAGQSVPWDHITPHYPSLEAEGLGPMLRARARADIVSNRGVPDEMETELKKYNEHPQQITPPTSQDWRSLPAPTNMTRPPHLPEAIEKQMRARWRAMNRPALEKSLREHLNYAKQDEAHPGEMFARRRQGYLYWAQLIRQELIRREGA